MIRKNALGAQCLVVMIGEVQSDKKDAILQREFRKAEIPLVHCSAQNHKCNDG